MKVKQKWLTVNEGDNVATAIGKGLIEGALSAGVTIITIGGVLLLFGKAGSKETVKKIDGE